MQLLKRIDEFEALRGAGSPALPADRLRLARRCAEAFRGRMSDGLGAPGRGPRP